MSPNPRQLAFNRKQIAASMPRARRALRLRQSGKTLADIGQILGVTRERARQLIVKALRYPEM